MISGATIFEKDKAFQLSVCIRLIRFLACQKKPKNKKQIIAHVGEEGELGNKGNYIVHLFLPFRECTLQFLKAAVGSFPVLPIFKNPTH